MLHKKYLLVLIIGLVGFFSTLPISAQIIATAEVSKEVIQLGEELPLLIKVERSEATTVDWPKMLGNIGAFEILSYSKKEVTPLENGKVAESQTVYLTSFDEGVAAIPSLVFKYRENNRRKQTQTRGIKIEVRSVPIDTTQAFLPIKDIATIDVPLIDYIKYYLNKYKWILLALLALLVGAFFFWKWYNGKEEIVEEVPEEIIPAHITALEKLRGIEKQQLWQQGEIKAFYSQITDVLREYVENKFEVPALESTTDEILEGLEKSDINPALSSKLQQLLTDADLVKFAKASPTQEMHRQKLKDAFVFVEHSKNINAEQDIEISG